MSPNYFELLGLALHFDVDGQELESAYFRQQRLCHPDRFVGKPAADRQAALQRSVDINAAYHTLKNPLARAQYLLHLQGIAVGTGQDSVKPSPKLLTETMEWHEQADAAADMNTIETLKSKLNRMYTESVEHIAKTCRDGDWESMAQETLRLGYLIKAQDAVAQRGKRFQKQAL